MRPGRGAQAVRRGSCAIALVALTAIACGADETRKEADCAGRKVDLFSDRANCGACGTTCRLDNICDVGACRCLSTTCGEKCVELGSDETNCGACDKNCAAGEICDRGVCSGKP